MSNKYTYSVPFSEKQLYDAYVNKGMNQYECADLFGVSQKVIWRAMKKMNVPARKAAKRNQKGSANSSWKGGRVLVNYKTPVGYRYLSDVNENKGYWMVRQPDHPMAGKNGYVYEHIVVALQNAGRAILVRKIECVHHIDFDRTHNTPDNLLICTYDKHREYHGKLESLAHNLLQKGLISFDAEKGYYLP